MYVFALFNVCCFRTRQLWNSKADLGTPAYLIPKTPTSPAATTPKNQLPNGDAPVSVEVVKANEQVNKLFICRTTQNYSVNSVKSLLLEQLLQLAT